MKKTALASALAFLAGVYLADTAKELRGALHYETKEGFSKHPYNLRIVRKDSPEGIESYVLDTRTNEHYKIADPKSRQKTLAQKVVEYLLY